MDDYNVVVNVSDDPYESLETSITKVRPYSCTCCIYRVPPRLRSVNETAYTPMLVSIGPLHHGNDKRLQMMEETKMRFLKNFIGRPNVSLRECFDIVKDKKESLRACYQETFGIKDDEFIKIIVVDAIFIVELFLTYYSQRLELPVEIERVLDAKWVLNEVRQDLLLLENQLPFFIIEDVWKLATRKWINETFYNHFNNHVGLHLKENDGLETIIKITPKHFVDLVRNLYIPLKPRQPTGKAKTFYAPSVTELQRAGVKFNVIESKSLFDISFSQGILEISKWIITDRTEVLFRNLIAFEQCHCSVDKAYICYYRRLMDYFVNTSEDVNLLVEEKIIENWLGDSNDVSNMINKLGFGVNISPNHFYFAEIFDDLNSHCEIPCNKWMANLKQNYFNTPWAIISFCAAVLLLILTIIQTVCSIISLEN